MKRRHLLAVAGLALAVSGCNDRGSPVAGNDVVHVESVNEIDANTAVSVVGPEGNATNAAAAALTPQGGEGPDYNTAALDARPESERGNLGGRSGE